MTTCPVCRQPASFQFLERYRSNDGNFKLFECAVCHVQFWSPFKNPGPEWYRQCQQNLRHRANNDREFLLWQAQHRSITKHFFRNPPHGRRLLDVGCGTGGFLVEAKKLGYDAQGVDFDEEQIATARNLGVSAQTEDIFSFLHNVHEPYDIITGFEIIEHLDRPAEFLQLIRRALEPGGFLVLTTPNRARIGPRNEFWDFPLHHVSRWDAQSLKNIVVRAGFRNVKIKEELPLRFLVGEMHIGLGAWIRKKKPTTASQPAYRDVIARVGSLKDTIVGAMLYPLALVLFLLGKKGQGLYLVARK